MCHSLKFHRLGWRALPVDLLLFCGLNLFYHINYYTFFQDWTRKGGWRVIKSRTACVPGDEGYPRTTDRSSPADYAARGFKTAPI
jgi:hypothetical protein